MHKGSCLCGTVKYEIAAPIERITHCHCTMCRKAHGAAFGSYATVARTAFRFTEGETMVAEYASSPDVIRTFCRRCGATLQWSMTSRSETVGIAVGTLDTPLDPPPQQHIFAASKADWYRIEDALPRSAQRAGPAA